jgi:hypothetical protein
MADGCRVLMGLGSGHVPCARKRWALGNAKALARDVGSRARVATHGKREGDGRWCFTVQRASKRVRVSVPGCSRAVVTAHDPFAPRIYVDGNSWRWPFAVSVLRDALGVDHG